MAANPVEPELTLHQSLPDLLRNLLRNTVEPDLVCTKASRLLLRNFLRSLIRNPVELNLALHQSLPPFPEPSPERYWTWPGLHQSLPNILRNPIELDLAATKLRNPVEFDLALHQSSPEPSPELHRNPVELDLALHQSLPNLHRNFSRTLLNLTWLCTKAGLRLHLPNAVFWTDKELAKLPKRCNYHTEAPCYWRMDQAFDLRLSLRKVAFWTDKKAPNCSLQASSTLPSSHRNTILLRHEQGLRPAAASA